MKKKITLKDKINQLEDEVRILKAQIDAYQKAFELIGIKDKQETYTLPYTDPSPYTPSFPVYPQPNFPPWYYYPQTFCGSDSTTTTNKDIIA
jgi:hypothetical protein